MINSRHKSSLYPTVRFDNAFSVPPTSSRIILNSFIDAVHRTPGSDLFILPRKGEFINNFRIGCHPVYRGQDDYGTKEIDTIHNYINKVTLLSGIYDHEIANYNLPDKFDTVNVVQPFYETDISLVEMPVFYGAMPKTELAILINFTGPREIEYSLSYDAYYSFDEKINHSLKNDTIECRTRVMMGDKDSNALLIYRHGTMSDLRLYG